MMDLAQLRDFAQRYTDAWCTHDPARVAAFFSLTGSLRVNAATPAVGRPAISETALSFMTAFPDLHLKMDDVIVQNEEAVYHWTLTGTNTGPGGTGQRVRISGFEAWKFADDGLIAESQGHFEDAGYQHQLKNGFSRSQS
jgi:nuclear transport factor 2 (NTF2) superfamily protein